MGKQSGADIISKVLKLQAVGYTQRETLDSGFRFCISYVCGVDRDPVVIASDDYCMLSDEGDVWRPNKTVFSRETMKARENDSNPERPYWGKPT